MSDLSSDDVISQNTNLQSLPTASPKPSFLLWDKVYQKLNGEDEENWLLRAAEAVLTHFKDEIKANEQSRCVLYSILRQILC